MKYEGLKKANHVLLFVFAVFFLVYYGAPFLIPLTFGIFIATLMTPFSNLLETSRLNRIFSAFISTLLIFIIVGSLSYLLFYQLSGLTKDLPQIRNELQAFIKNFQDEVSSMTGMSLEEQDLFLQSRSDSIILTIQIYLTRFLSNILDTALNFLLVLIYVFLLLLYRSKFWNFIMMYVPDKKEEKTDHVLHKISKVVHQYLWGRVKVMVLLGIMYYITFLIFGIPYAILLTIFGAMITIIPYIGPFISGLLPIVFSILFGMDLYHVLVFSIVIIVIQLIESYFLEPIIIGKEVELNPLTVIVAVLIGGMTWGIAGMILFVPIFAMIKIISNQNEKLRPLGYLLGTSDLSNRKDMK